MTCELYLIGQPENSGTDTHTIPAGNTAQLSFGAANIKGMQLDGDGGLIVMLEDGGQVIVDNYEAFACEEHNLTLSDGTVVDLDTLSTSFQTAEALFGQFAVQPPIDNIIDKPSENEIAEIALNHGEKYVCNFDPETLNQAMVEVVDGNMILNFADGSQIVFSDFVELIDGELPPELTLADGTVIDSDELLIDVANIEESLENIEPASGNEEPSTEDLAALAEELADIETAAGEGGSSNSGFGFGSSFSSTEFNSPDDIGALGATSLNYVAPDFTDDNRLIAEDAIPELTVGNEFLDETSLLLGPIERTGQVNVDFGGDGAGAISSNGSFSFGGSVQNNQLTSQGEPITIVRTSNGYEGVVDGEITFEFTIQPNGEYSFIQHASIDHGDPNNQNETLTLNFGVRAVDSDGDVSNSAVAVTIADDAPIILSQISATVDETDMTGIGLFTVGQFNVDMGQDINETGAFSTNGEFVVSGSVDNNQLSSNGVSIAVTATDTGYIGVAGDLIVFELNIDPDTGSYGYQQFAGIDHADASDPNDALSLHFGLQVTDSDGDSAGGFVTINVHDDAPVALNDGERGVKEENNVTGNVRDNDIDSQDDLGQGFSAVSTVTFGGVDYNMPENGTLTVQGNQGTLTINIDGSYTYTAANDGTAGIDSFSYTLTDSDGDRDTADISFNVYTNGLPTAVNDTFNVGLLNPNGDTIGNILNNDDFGTDGAGSPQIASFSYEGQTVSAGESIDTDLGIVSILSDGSITLDRPEAIVSVGSSTSTQNFAEVFGEVVTSGRGAGEQSSSFRDITTTTTTTTTNVPGGILNLTYIIQDSDGDQDSAQVIINLEEANDTGTSTTQTSKASPHGKTPLVFDLDGDGIELVNENDGILFDIDVDGELEQTGFVAADDGLLAIDRNNDGVISNRDELFGDTRGFNDGFENLATFDSNQDGVVDKNDDAFGELLIFQDVNQDGVSQEDELHSLEDIGIASIDVGNYFETDYHINDQFIGFESTFSFDDGTEGVVVDAFFNYYEVNDSGGTEVFSYSGVDALTSFGQDVNVIFDDSTGIYQGVAGGDIVFNIQISEDGSHSFNLFSPLDNDGADIELKFGNGDNAIDISVTQDDINNLLSETDPSVWMGAIQEGAQSLAEISEGDGATDFSFVVDNGDDITESIQEWVHSDDNDDTFVSDNNASDANEGNSAMFDVVATDLPALAEDNGSII